MTDLEKMVLTNMSDFLMIVADRYKDIQEHPEKYEDTLTPVVFM